jgi:hypothetical protein
MTQDYHKPTHSLIGNGTYNASQVRLYGIHAKLTAKLPLNLGELKIVSSSDEGTEKSVEIDNVLNINSRSDEPVLVISPGTKRSIGIIYGYAFEGHCYDLPKPMIMLIPVDPERTVPGKDCDYDGRPGYSVWVVDKLDQCDVIEVNSGFIEQLVLDANMPGKRSPSTYRAHMQLAHRSGRMTE